MKILHVIPYADLSYGGPSVVVRSMAEVMARQGAEVHIAVTNAAGTQDLALEDGEVRYENGAIFHSFRRTFPKGWFRAPGMMRWLNAHAGDFGLLHLHVPFTAPFRWGARAAQNAGRPYLVTPHGVLDPWSMRQKAWKKRPYFRLERQAIAAAAAIHVTSPLEACFIRELKLGPRIQCLPLAVNLPATASLAPKPTGGVRILCIARVHPVKALPVLFGALAQLRAKGLDVVLDLAGSGDVAYVLELRQKLDELGLADAVVWHGHVGDEQKRDLYASASCFVLLSHHENFGLAAAEALAAGLPVVVSDQVGLAPDILSYQAGCVVAVGDSRATAAALQHVLATENQQAYRARARFLAAERYGESAFAAGLANLYCSIAANPILT